MNPENPIDALAEPSRSVVDALIDGESVDKADLREALARADVRDYFIDALLLRRLAIDMGPNTFHVAGRPVAPAARAVRWVAAAAVVVATATGSYLVGREQATVDAMDRPGISDVATPVADAPPPTRVIRFERGTNWVSNLEGN